MKQITKDTVLKQGDKSYPAIEIKIKCDECGGDGIFIDNDSNRHKCINCNKGISEQGIVWVDKDTTVILNDIVYDLISKTIYKITGMYTLEYSNIHYPNSWYKIVAANFELEGVPKIELKNEVEKLADNDFVNSVYFAFTDQVKLNLKYFKSKLKMIWYNGYKANQAKYTEEELEWAFMRGVLINQRSHNGEILSFSVERNKDIQSLNSIKEIIVDDKFQIIIH